MSTTLTLKLILRDCDKEFKAGMGKGVLVTQDVVLNDDFDRATDAMKAVACMDQEDSFIKRYIRVEVQANE